MKLFLPLILAFSFSAWASGPDDVDLESATTEATAKEHKNCPKCTAQMYPHALTRHADTTLSKVRETLGEKGGSETKGRTGTTR